MSSNAFFEINRQALRVYYGQNLTFYPHFHSSLEIFISLEGQTKVVVEDHIKLQSSGDAAIVWPNHVHSYTAMTATRYLIAIIDLSLIHEYAPKITQHGCPNPFIDKEQIHPDILHCMETLAKSSNIGEPLCRAYLGVIIGRLLEVLPLGERKKAPSHDSLRELITFIDAHIMEPISLERLSKHLYLNKYYISKLFSQRIGCSLHTYVNAIRIERACAMLLGTTVNISEVVDACGFESERTFYRAFMTHRGITPKAYREQAIKTRN